VSAVRYPKSAVVGGRIGNARIRDEIAGASAELAAPTGAPLSPALSAMVRQSPLDSMRALGRLPKGQMNKTEAAYAAHLDAKRSLGEVLWFRFEGLKLRLADNTFYDTDFVVLVASGQLEVHEVKGFMMDDAAVKLKVAASQYPFVFRLVRKGKGGNWDIREV
jgi:hypothetical protein